MARGEQKEKLGTALSQATSAQQTIKTLRERLDHQRLLMQGMWEMMKARMGCSDDDLRQLLIELQKKDHEAPKTAENCRNCGRPLQDNTPICVYCGELHESVKLF